MVNSDERISWKSTTNSVVNRMIDNSLVHELESKRKIQKRTKMVNRIINQRSGSINYEKYLNIKTSVMKKLPMDDETEEEENLSDDDYTILYKSDLSLANVISEEKSDINDKDTSSIVEKTCKTEENSSKSEIKMKPIESYFIRLGRNASKQFNDSLVSTNDKHMNDQEKNVKKEPCVSVCPAESNSDKDISGSKNEKDTATMCDTNNTNVTAKLDTSHMSLNSNTLSMFNSTTCSTIFTLPSQMYEEQVYPVETDGINAIPPTNTRMHTESSNAMIKSNLSMPVADINPTSLIPNENTNTDSKCNMELHKIQQGKESIDITNNTMHFPNNSEISRFNNEDKFEDVPTVKWSHLSLLNIHPIGQSTPLQKEKSQIHLDKSILKETTVSSQLCNHNLNDDSNEKSMNNENLSSQLNLDEVHKQTLSLKVKCSKVVNTKYKIISAENHKEFEDTNNYSDVCINPITLEDPLSGTTEDIVNEYQHNAMEYNCNKQNATKSEKDEILIEKYENKKIYDLDEENYVSPSTTMHLQQFKQLSLTGGSESSFNENDKNSCKKTEIYIEDGNIDYNVTNRNNSTEPAMPEINEKYKDGFEENKEMLRAEIIHENNVGLNIHNQLDTEDNKSVSMTVDKSMKQSYSSHEVNTQNELITDESLPKKDSIQLKETDSVQLKETLIRSSPKHVLVDHCVSPHETVVAKHMTVDSSQRNPLVQMTMHISSRENTTVMDHEKKNVIGDKKTFITLNSTEEPTKAKSSRRALKRLSRKKKQKDKEINCSENLNALNHLSDKHMSRVDVSSPMNHPELLQTLQDFKCKNDLKEDISTSTLTLEDMSKDDEVFILTVPHTVSLSDLKNKKLVIKRNALKIGEMKYEIRYRTANTVPCIVKTEKDCTLYKTVNVKPVSAITVKHKLPCTSSMNTIAEGHEISCQYEKMACGEPSNITTKKEAKKWKLQDNTVCDISNENNKRKKKSCKRRKLDIKEESKDFYALSANKEQRKKKLRLSLCNKRKRQSI